MKKLLAILLIIALVAGGCYGVRSLRSTPRRTVERMMDALAKGNVSKAERYIQEGTLNANSTDYNGRRFYKLMFSSLSYNITGVEIENNTARVTVAVTMMDMDDLLSQATLSSLAEPGLLGRTNYYKQVVKQMKSGDVSYGMITGRAYLVKENGTWKISMSDSTSFAKAITGGRNDLIGYTG